MNSNIFRSMSYGVYIISTTDGERPTGCTANSVMQITSVPATIAVSINHNNFTNECITQTGSFAISILSEQSDPRIIGVFGFRTGKTVDKFAEIPYEEKLGMPVVKDSCGYIVCKVINRMETETHTVFLGEVIEGDVFEGQKNPMTYAYYHRELKGKSPQNAPTYLPEESKKQVEESPKPAKEPEKATGTKVKYVCQVCGYEYEGESLPVDFKCPLCGQGQDKFVRVESKE